MRRKLNASIDTSNDFEIIISHITYLLTFDILNDTQINLIKRYLFELNDGLQYVSNHIPISLQLNGKYLPLKNYTLDNTINNTECNTLELLKTYLFEYEAYYTKRK